ncbi:MAG TPA: hypothetical protein DCL21_04460 [Alphaproteobacteria bacterium]|nr:hypothetical protein [Alphaproteobacteria bacterium]
MRVGFAMSLALASCHANAGSILAEVSRIETQKLVKQNYYDSFQYRKRCKLDNKLHNIKPGKTF